MFLWSTVLNCGSIVGLEVFVAVTTFLLRSSAQRCLTPYQELMGRTAETCPRLALVVLEVVAFILCAAKSHFQEDACCFWRGTCICSRKGFPFSSSSRLGQDIHLMQNTVACREGTGRNSSHPLPVTVPPSLWLLCLEGFHPCLGGISCQNKAPPSEIPGVQWAPTRFKYTCVPCILCWLV